jgi:heme-degrading monooxygenase HmoA
MFAVIFEVQPKPDRFQEYLGIAKALRPAIEKIDGFVDNERFQSRATKGRLLSLSIWRDEKALVRWRTLDAHHVAQEKGRFEIFEDYQLRVGEIVADTQPRAGGPTREQRFDETEVGAAKAVTLTVVPPGGDALSTATDLAAALQVPAIGTAGVIAVEAFASITQEGKHLLLASWQDDAQARAWLGTRKDAGRRHHRVVRVIRDYGLADRREAPQYYPPVDRGQVSAARRDAAGHGGSVSAIPESPTAAASSEPTP